MRLSELILSVSMTGAGKSEVPLLEELISFCLHPMWGKNKHID